VVGRDVDGQSWFHLTAVELSSDRDLARVVGAAEYGDPEAA